MDTLREVIQVLDRYKVREINVLTNPKLNQRSIQKESRYFELYAGIREGKWETEEDCAAHFGMEANSRKFNRFKNETKKRLYNSLLFIDTTLPEFNDYNRAYVNLMQQWSVAKSLQHRGARAAFLEIAEQALKVAQQFEYTDAEFDVLKAIKMTTLPYPGSHKTFLQRKEQYIRCKETYQAELLAREAYEDLLFPLIKKKGFRKEQACIAFELVEKLKPYAEQVQTVGFQYYYRIIDLYGSILQHDWEKALIKAGSAKTFFLEKPFQPLFCIIAFSHQLAGAMIMLNQFEDAYKECSLLLPLLSDEHTNWFKTNELMVVSLMYSGNYPEAWEIQKSVQKNKNYYRISQMDKEAWLVFKGYLSLLGKLGILELSPREKGEIEKFRLSSWLNDLPLYSQDKRGANIPVLLAQAIFLLLDDRYDEFDNRIEALRKYRQRNLDPENEHVRSHIFIRMLETVPKNGYQPDAIEEDAQEWLKKLGDYDPDIMDRNYELEVVPYERQWNWVLGILRNESLKI